MDKTVVVPVSNYRQEAELLRFRDEVIDIRARALIRQGWATNEAYKQAEQEYEGKQS